MLRRSVLILVATVSTAQASTAGIGEIITDQPIGELGSMVAGAGAIGGNATYGVQRTTVSKVPLWRDSGCLTMIYDTTTISDAQAAVLDKAFGAWADASGTCGGGLVFERIRKPAIAARDGLNTVTLHQDRWCRPATADAAEQCYAKTATAVTRLVFVDDPSSPEDGKILEADMELNGVDFELLAPDQVGPTTAKLGIDLQAVATHEAGHVLGLAHNCGTGREAWPMDRAGAAVPSCDGLPGDSSVRHATMYYEVAPGDTSPRTIEASDLAGACTLTEELTCEHTVQGGCSASGRGAGVLVGFSLLLVRRRRRA